jgi:hypothetical protein
MGTLKSAVDEFQTILAGNQLAQLTETQVSVPHADGQWSRKQILGHLLDSAANNHHRFVRGMIQMTVAMPGYEQNLWVIAGRYHERRWNDLVAWWSAYNLHLLHMMETAPADRLATEMRIGDGKTVTLEFLMIDYVRHLKHHWEQILS